MRVALLAGYLGLVLSGLAPLLAEEPPRYLFFNIAPGAPWNQNRPGTFTRAVFDEVVHTLQAPDNPRLRIGVAFIFSTLETPTDTLVQSLRRLLAASEDSGVPVLVALDGQNWWQHRPDLWNWWDPTGAGYNPSNVYNVEWTGWSPTQAVKVGWRNWGSQLRVVPAPNIASPAVIAAHLEGVRALVPVIVEWQRRLPASRRHLFGGVKLGSEAGIGYNAYYYPDGNRYLEQWPHDWSHDPTNLLSPAKGLSCGVCQLGYAAVKTAGLKDRGEITREDIGRVTQLYLEQLCRLARKLGLPRDAIFTHQGGTYDPWEKHLPFWPAFNRWSSPGWSFYHGGPREAVPLEAELKAAGRRRWAAAEWWWGGANSAEWEDHFRSTLAFRDCRFICVYNWNQGMFQKAVAGQEAVRNLVRTWRD
ncbi:MAG TPA: hypothetical protein P5205_02960 [Candidatus Paceibacterota bacterium]|nr:hypothetical protein [Candidatus Paceibacterota bacterium]